jgi:hypothetical protein
MSDRPETANQLTDMDVAQPPQAPFEPSYPYNCDGKEQFAFEAWAKEQRYDMNEHPLHYLFTDPKTYAARMGWNAAIAYCRKMTLND